MAMTDEDRDDLLGTGGTGVLSVARGAAEPPYTVPISYGYDAEGGQFYFRLAFGTDSGKHDVVTDGAQATFVTYRETSEGWQSVVATGQLEAIDEDHPDTATLDAMRHIDIPLFDVFEEETRTLEFHFFRLVPGTLTGRRENPIRE